MTIESSSRTRRLERVFPHRVDRNLRVRNQTTIWELIVNGIHNQELTVTRQTKHGFGHFRRDKYGVSPLTWRGDRLGPLSG